MYNRSIKISSPAGIGVATVLVFFTILILVSFGVLSISTARANSVMVEKNVIAQQQYYSAFSKAQKEISKIDMNLKNLYYEGNYSVENILSLQDGLYIDENGIFCEFEQVIDENRTIVVKLKIKDNVACGDTLYTIDCFRTRVNTDIETDDSIPVYKE